MNTKTDATIDELADFLAMSLFEIYQIGSFDRCRDFIDATIPEIKKTIQESLIQFTTEHPVRDEE